MESAEALDLQDSALKYVDHVVAEYIFSFYIEISML